MYYHPHYGSLRQKRERERNDQINYLKKIIAENFPKVEKEAHSHPGSIESHKQNQPKKSTPRHIII